MKVFHQIIKIFLLAVINNIILQQQYWELVIQY